ncbi:unnamed protein product [Lactuca saligna]|uniref:Uncharacterized protein n=1 Tax=Lactuca saligna TaxID=75948 RepID=A0AA35ZS87_LACSI|nr:unnamed protein product [Lactuca saligna]
MFEFTHVDDDCDLSLQEIWRKLVENASKFLNDKVTKAVIIVSAYFNDSHRTTTKDACCIAYGFVVSVLEVGDGVFEVLSTSKGTHLGGDDFDKRIVDWNAASFKKYEGIDELKDKQALQWLTEIIEKAKMELSTLTHASIKYMNHLKKFLVVLTF